MLQSSPKSDPLRSKTPSIEDNLGCHSKWILFLEVLEESYFNTLSLRALQCGKGLKTSVAVFPGIFSGYSGNSQDCSAGSRSPVWCYLTFLLSTWRIRWADQGLIPKDPMKITQRSVELGWWLYQVKCNSPFQMLFPASGMPSLIPTPCVLHPLGWLSLCSLCHFLDRLLDTPPLLHWSCCMAFLFPSVSLPSDSAPGERGTDLVIPLPLDLSSDS